MPETIVPAQEAAPRIGYQSRVTFTSDPTNAGDVDPDKLHLCGVTALRALPGVGIWLDCLFDYTGPRGVYVLQAPVLFGFDCLPTGRIYLRSCTCRDWQKRDAAGQRGAASSCKHLLALGAKLAAAVDAGTAGQMVPGNASPAHGFMPPVNPVGARLLAIWSGANSSLNNLPGCAQYAGGETLAAA